MHATEAKTMGQSHDTAGEIQQLEREFWQALVDEDADTAAMAAIASRLIAA